jgi:hypothetical protein
MNQDDQRLVLMAAAAQAHYAKQQARREARKAALLSQVSALSNLRPCCAATRWIRILSSGS